MANYLLKAPPANIGQAGGLISTWVSEGTHKIQIIAEGLPH